MIDYSTLTITIDDIRKAGFCSAGVKRWFKAQGLDFQSLLKNGISAESLLATSDAQAEKVVQSKIERENLDG